MRALLFLFCLSLAAAAAKPPNVVVFLSDDQGWGDLGHSGNSDLATPRIDSLAKQGVRFERFYVCPVCSPTRAEFLTGRHHARSGVYSTSAGGERMDLDETTVADLFQKAGYRTGAFGKWHNGMQYPYHPNGRGFDEFYGFCSGHWGNYFDPMLEHNGRIVKGEGFCIDDFTNRAMAFIGEAVKADQPFFAYLPYNTPHSPMQVPERFWKRFSKRPLEFTNERHGEKPAQDLHKRCALAMCENLDWNVGRVLDQLDTLGIADDTIVVWFHDNGPNGFRWNGGMKGKKGSTDEGGVRSPLHIRWPGKIPAGRSVPEIASVRDLLPTLCELAHVKGRPQKPLDGTSLKPLLTRASTPWPERTLVQQWQGRISVRSQQYRLDHTGKLFDMIADPGQREPVNKQHPDISKRLTTAAEAHRKEHMPGYRKDNRPFIITHPGSTLTQLPARDGTAKGKIKRSNRFPNCSYFTNWTNTGDKITFNGRVEAAGVYQVTLYYAAKKPGARMELRFQDAVLAFRIPEAHTPPERGRDEDRFPRMESYVKDFKALSIGRITLEKGDGNLTLQATDIPGDEAIEFRLLTLERVASADQ